MRCPKCDSKMKKRKEAMEFEVSPKVIVENIGVDECCNCGFSSVSEKEYERVRKQLKAVTTRRGGKAFYPQAVQLSSYAPRG